MGGISGLSFRLCRIWWTSVPHMLSPVFQKRRPLSPCKNTRCHCSNSSSSQCDHNNLVVCSWWGEGWSVIECVTLSTDTSEDKLNTSSKLQFLLLKLLQHANLKIFRQPLPVYHSANLPAQSMQGLMGLIYWGHYWNHSIFPPYFHPLLSHFSKGWR